MFQCGNDIVTTCSVGLLQLFVGRQTLGKAFCGCLWKKNMISD